MATRIYTSTHIATSERRMVRGHSPAQVRDHIARTTLAVQVTTVEQALELQAAGVVVEQAGRDDSADTETEGAAS